MKINSLVETSAGATGSGSVASVSSPIGAMNKRAGSMFKGKKTNKPFYEEKKDCGCSKECKCHENITEGKVKQLMMDLEEMSDKEFLAKYNKTKKEMRNGLNEGAMPQSVIKTKENIRMASDEENKKRFAGKTKEELASMARRHGYKDKNPYSKFHDGTTGTNESKILRGMLEADLHEDDLILMPGQGARFKKELMPKKTDHEVEMARGQLYQSAKNAKDICHMLEGISEMEGIDAWVQSKITTAADYLETVRAYLESKYEMHHEVEEAVRGIHRTLSGERRPESQSERDSLSRQLKLGREKNRADTRVTGYGSRVAPQRGADSAGSGMAVHTSKEFGQEVATDYDSRKNYHPDYVSKGNKLRLPGGSGKGVKSHDVDEATAHEKFKKSVKNRGYDMDAGASRLERLLAKQKRERAEFEKKYASAYGTKEVDEGAWDDIKSTAGKAWDTVTDKLSNIGYSDPAEYGRAFSDANKGISPDESSKMYQQQLQKRKQWQKDMSPNPNEVEKDRSGYKPYPTDARPVREEELNEIGWNNAADYGKDFAAANKYVPPAPKQAAPAGPSLWDRAKGVAASLRPFDEKTAASNFGYKPQQVAQAKTAPQTPMYEEDDEEKVVRKPKQKAVVKTNKPIGSRVADIGPGGKEYNVKTDKAWDDHHKVSEEVEGLWANIHAKRERIKQGSGERMRKPGSKGAPTKDAFKQSAKKK
jgi:hypothetical protein